MLTTHAAVDLEAGLMTKGGNSFLAVSLLTAIGDRFDISEPDGMERRLVAAGAEIPFLDLINNEADLPYWTYHNRGRLLKAWRRAERAGELFPCNRAVNALLARLRRLPADTASDSLSAPAAPNA